MRQAIAVAIVAAWPPTLAALLTFLAARASDRRASTERAAVVDRTLDQLAATVTRIEATGQRLDTTIADVRERLARLEGMNLATASARDD